jgi:predicted MFS family arabinose efflux permease
LYFGFFWAGLNFIVAFGSVLAARVQRHIRFRVLFGLIAAAPFLLYIGMALLANSTVAVVFVSLFWLLRGIVMPIISDYVQREATERNRATVLSANALMIRLVFSVTSPFIGWLTDVYSFQMAFTASAIVFGLIAVFAYINWLFHIETTATT